MALVVVMSSCNSQTPANTNANTSKDSVTVNAGDPLPAWNDGQLKKDIIAYVEKVTKEGSADFIPVENRIATFDNEEHYGRRNFMFRNCLLFFA